MTRIICLLFLLFSNLSFSKQSFKETEDELLEQLSTTREEIEKEWIAWESEFTQFLIDDEDPNTQLLGYYNQLFEFNDNDKLSNLATELNLILSSNQLDNKSLTTLAQMCSDSKIKSYCDQDATFALQLQYMPDNAFIYLSSLETAIKDANQKGITQAIDDMADSKYFDSFYYLHPAYRVKLEQYVNNHPFPENKLAVDKLDINRQLCCDKVETTEDVQDIIIHINVIGMKMAQSIPAFRNIIQTCLNDVSQEKSCLKIAEILINRSKSIISASIGYAIKLNVFKQKGDDKTIQQITQKKFNYTKRYECLADIFRYGSTQLSLKGVVFLKLADSIERKYGELAYFESLAQSNYDYYSSLGDTEIKNPEDCK